MRGGLPNLIAGSVLAAAGGAILTIMSDFASAYGETYAFAGVDYRLLLGGVIVAGLIIFGLGVFQRFRPPPATVTAARTDAQVIFRAMIAMVGVDSKEQDDEVEMVQHCCKHFFQRDMRDIEIWKAVQVHGRNNTGGFAFDGAEQTSTPEARATAYTAALLIAKTDGEVSETERAKLSRLANLLRLDADAQGKATAEAESLYVKLRLETPAATA